jgi:holin-like protein
MLLGFFYILLFLFLGEMATWLLGLAVPGNVVGMLLIFFALRLNVIKLKAVKPATTWLMKYFALFFVPAGVGLMLHFDLLGAHWLPILVSSVISTVLVLLCTGVGFSFFKKTR